MYGNAPIHVPFHAARYRPSATVSRAAGTPSGQTAMPDTQSYLGTNQGRLREQEIIHKAQNIIKARPISPWNQRNPLRSCSNLIIQIDSNGNTNLLGSARGHKTSMNSRSVSIRDPLLSHVLVLHHRLQDPPISLLLTAISIIEVIEDMFHLEGNAKMTRMTIAEPPKMADDGDEGGYPARARASRNSFDRPDENVRKLYKLFEIQYPKMKFRGDYNAK